MSGYNLRSTPNPNISNRGQSESDLSDVPEPSTPTPTPRSAMADSALLLARIAELEARLATTAPFEPEPSIHPSSASFRRGPTEEVDSDQDPTRHGDIDVVIEKPEPFRGDTKSLSTFLAQVAMYTDLQPKRFSSDFKRIIYAGSLFREWPATWWTAHYTAQHKPTWMYNWEEFKVVLVQTFNPVDREAEAARRISTLKQTRSAAEYYTRFLEYSVEANWNEPSQVYAFKQGLRPEIRDALAVRDSEPHTLSDLASLCIRIDQRIHDRHNEVRSTSRTIEIRPERPGRPSADRPTYITNRQPSAPTSRPSPPISTRPFQRDNTTRSSSRIPGTPLSAEERQRRMMTGACLVCGEKGHLRDDCPKRKIFTASTGSTVNNISAPGNPGKVQSPAFPT